MIYNIETPIHFTAFTLVRCNIVGVKKPQKINLEYIVWECHLNEQSLHLLKKIEVDRNNL